MSDMQTHVEKALPVLEPEPVASVWQASIELAFQASRGSCRLARSRHSGPLYVQKPFYPEGKNLAHVYLLHPPGGLVSGDDLKIDVQLEAGAQALLTTPGAGRVYRARKDRSLQTQRVRLRVDEGATLEWMPLETIVYRDANARLETRVELAKGARYIGWEITSLGLPASDVVFDCGHLQQRLRIEREGLPVLIENLHLADNLLSLFESKAGLQGKPVSALFVAGPFLAGALDDALFQCARDILNEGSRQNGAGISRVGDFVVARCLDDCTHRVRMKLVALWGILRPVLIQREACAPRIWAT